MRDPKFLAALEKGDPRAHRICLDLAEAFLDTIALMRGQKGLLNATERSHVHSRLNKLRDQAGSARKVLGSSVR
jgi:hypothetical protein